MTWPVALFLSFAALLTLAHVGAICALLGLGICDAGARLLRRLRRRA